LAHDGPSGDREDVPVPRTSGLQVLESASLPEQEFLDFKLSVIVEPESPTGFYRPGSWLDAADELELALPDSYLGRIRNFEASHPNRHFYDVDDAASHVASIVIERWGLKETARHFTEPVIVRNITRDDDIGRALFAVLRLRLQGKGVEQIGRSLRRLGQMALIHENDRLRPLYDRPEQCSSGERPVTHLVKLGVYFRVTRIVKCGTNKFLYFWDFGWIDSEDIEYELVH